MQNLQTGAFKRICKSNTMTRLPSVKIMVCYHKPEHIFKSSVLKPIRLGRALVKNKEPDVLAAMPGDDTGDNISQLNHKFCEMTALYWAWRNYGALGNPDYCGLMHYRRLLDFSLSRKLSVIHLEKPEDVWPESIAPKTIYSVVPDYDICIKSPIGITYMPKDGPEQMYTVTGQYLDVHSDSYLINAFALAAEKYPHYIEDIKAYSNSTAHYLCNMAVMKKEVFFDYAQWMFSLLLPLENMIDYARPGQDIRVISYISERLTGLYITHQCRLQKLKIKHIPSININCW